MANIRTALILDEHGNPTTGKYYTVEWRMVASDICATRWATWKFTYAGDDKSLSFITLEDAFERIQTDTNCKLYETLGGTGIYQPNNTTTWQVRFVKTNTPPIELEKDAPWRIGISDIIDKKPKKRKSKKL